MKISGLIIAGLILLAGCDKEPFEVNDAKVYKWERDLYVRAMHPAANVMESDLSQNQGAEKTMCF